jgi:4'-phosphopantetheinyl transferase
VGGTGAPFHLAAAQVAAAVSHVESIEDIEIWTARPDTPDDLQWRELALLLDDAEQFRSRQFKIEADRRSFVLAHALRRAALARAAGLAPEALVFAQSAQGQPLLAGAAAHAGIFFSHARSRELVACAVTRAAPVGIDVERIDSTAADFALLEPFVALPEASRRTAEVDADPSRQFFFYWTALEAVWKAAGTGLSSANPRMRCVPQGPQTFEIGLEDEEWSQPIARVIRISSDPACSVALALDGMRQLGKRKR